MSRKLKIGVIGMGAQGSHYASILNQEKGDYILSALSSRSEDKREYFNKLYPTIPYFFDWKDLINSNTVEAVIIATTNSTHPLIASYAIKKGIHVLLDKPTALHYKAAKELNNIADQHPAVVFGAIYQRRTNSVYQRVKEIVETNELGNLRKNLMISTAWWRPDKYYSQSVSRGTWGGEGGGVLINQALHQLDIWQWICGMPNKLYANVQLGLYREVEIENDVTIISEYKNGVTGCFITTAYDPLGIDRFELTFDKGKIVIEGVGEKATLYRLKTSETEMNKEMPLEGVKDFIQGKAVDNLYTTEVITCSEKWAEQHHLTIQNFVSKVLNNTKLLIPGKEGINSLELVNAALMSGFTRSEIALPIDGDKYLEKLNELIKNEGLFEPL